MKRILSLLLALLMLTGAVALFSSCKKEVDGDVTLSRGTEEVDLSDYVLVYGASQSEAEYTATVKGEIEAFATRLSAVTGKNFNAREAARSTEQEKEILIGNTGRTASVEAAAELKGEGFVILVDEGKIVILGTDNLFTMLGLQFFAKRYLDGTQSGATLTLNESAIALDVERVVLVDANKGTTGDTSGVFTYVHKHGIGSLPSSYAATGSSHASSTYKEYPQTAIEEIQKTLKEASGLGNKFFPSDTDKTEHEREVLIGQTARTECTNALAGIAENEYVVSVDSARVVVSSWSEAGLQMAVTAYMDLLTEGSVKTDDKLVISLPRGFCLIGNTNEAWEVDFPKPEGEGISLYNTMSANDGALQFLYTGAGVNADSYRAYCAQLESAGYTVYMKNEAAGSIFTTYVNKEEKIALYVAYNAYAHKGDFEEFKWALSHSKTGDKNVYEYDPCFRIVSAPMKTAHLPAQELLTPQDYEKVTDSKVTVMPLFSGAVGLCYIITLEDGSFVVFDGGNNTTAGSEYDLLWRALRKLHQDIYKSGPTVDKPVRIAAWILTHAHGDHYKVFKKMGDAYGGTGLMKVDRMIANIPAVDSVTTLTNGVARAMTPEHVKSLQNSFKGGFDYVKVHTGQKFYMANLELEVITTWEDLNPLVPNNSNDTNTVVRFTLTNKDDPAAKVTQMWTGDANRWQSRFMCATYGEYLKSDMVSVAHHGHNGCEVDFYTMVSPTAVWWPHHAGSVRSYLNPAKYKSDFRHQTDQYLCNELESVKYVYTAGVAGGSTGGMDYFTTLVLKASGPDYDGIYDLFTGEILPYSDITTGAYANISACMKK